MRERTAVVSKLANSAARFRGPLPMPAPQPGCQRQDRQPAAKHRSNPKMTLQSRELYSSSNGDRWFLVHTPASNEVLIKHSPNPASGGRHSLSDIGEFLAQGHGPQHVALLRLIGTLTKVRRRPAKLGVTPSRVGCIWTAYWAATRRIASRRKFFCVGGLARVGRAACAGCGGSPRPGG
jgi:hypothetical protein